MASYTDNLQYLTNYSPYVEQFPVEAAVTVGRIKQQQYDQGIEKIQSNIDNIAGMDVIRDVDKQYLQSKLNQMSGNLKKVAAGDFSNYQLVNSVGGMINQIGRDSNIQNAVSSTIRYKKGISDMDVAIKEGKSSPSNEWDFANQANKWLSSPDIKEGFRGGYVPYTNYKKNALDAIKSLTKDETITDDAFTLDAKGNLVIADATVRKKLAGVSPEKIQQALMGTLSPSDFKQMEIDGRYTYANVSPQRFMQDINSSFADKISFYNSQKTILQNAKSSTTSNVEKTRLDDQIASLNKTINSITSQSRGMSEMVAMGNIEAVKAQLHTNNFIDNFSKAFSYTETSLTYQGKTPQEMNMWRADKEQDWKKFLLQMNFDREKFALTYSQEERKMGQKDKESFGYGGLPQGVSQEDLPVYTLNKIISDTEDTTRSIDQSDDVFMRQQGKDKEWLDSQKTAWQKSPKAVDPKIADHFNRTEEARRVTDSNKAMIVDIQKQAVQEFGTIKDIIPNDPPLTYTNPEGQSYSMAPSDFVNYNENYRKYISFNIDPKSPLTFDFEKAQRELSTNEFEILKAVGGYYPSNSPNREISNLSKRLYHYDQTVNSPFKETLKEINKFTADEVSKRIIVNQGVSYGIPTPNEAAKSQIGTVMMQFANLATSQDGKLPNSPGLDVDVANALSTDPTTSYSLTVVEGTQYQPAMYKINATGKEGTTEFRITPEQKTAIFGNMFEVSPVVQAFRPYQEQIRKMGGYSTALSTGVSTHDNAYLGKIDFPKVEIFGVKANIEQPSPGKYSIRISAYDPVRKQWFDDISYPRNQLVREDQVIPLMTGLNDAAVFELLNDTPPTSEDLKRIQQASKKPL